MAKRLVMMNGVSASCGIAAALLLKQQSASRETSCELWAVADGQVRAFLRGLLAIGRYSSVQFLDFPRSAEIVREVHLASFDGDFSFRSTSGCAGDDIVQEIGRRLVIPAETFAPIRRAYVGEGEHSYPKLFGAAAALFRDTGETALFYRLIRRLAEGMDAEQAAVQEKRWLALVGLPCVFGRTRLDEAKRHCFELRKALGDNPDFDAILADVLTEMWDANRNRWREVLEIYHSRHLPKGRMERPRFGDEDGTAWSPEAYDFSRSRLVGRSLPLERLRHDLEYACKASPVTIVGEGGSDMECVARRLHCGSHPSFAKFFAYDCAGADREETRRAIFGMEKGDKKHYRGFLDKADGGTLFLTGITDMDMETQGHLLHYLESGEFKYFAATVTHYSAAKVIVALDRQPEELAAKELLRPDLAMRLSLCRITLPALRERKEDIAIITNDFWKAQESGELDTAQIGALANYDYPGNEQELLTLLQRAAICGEQDFGKLLAEHRAFAERLPAPEQKNMVSAPTSTPPAQGGIDGQLGDPRLSLADIVRKHAYGVYLALGRRKREAAGALGIAFNTFNKYLNEMENTQKKGE